MCLKWCLQELSLKLCSRDERVKSNAVHAERRRWRTQTRWCLCEGGAGEAQSLDVGRTPTWPQPQLKWTKSRPSCKCSDFRFSSNSPPVRSSFTQMTKGGWASWKCRMGTFGLGLSCESSWQ